MLGILGDKKEIKSVVVAMSGGVDSSTVAAILAQKYKVIGITLQLYNYGMAVGKPGSCCAGQDIYDARMVCDKLGIPHYVLDYEKMFKSEVIDDFVDSYMRGETPLPCVRCNQKIKFKDLMEVSRDLGADALVTGHYVRKVIGVDGPELHIGSDPKKDQSYFLFTTTKEQLDYIYFPLGSITKDETRKCAKSLGLMVAEKKDSQDICFVPNGKYADVISQINPHINRKGKVMHIDGYELGEHEGVAHYTIGQRRGLGIAWHEPLYVTKIAPQENIVFVGPREALQVQEFFIKEVNWLGVGDAPLDGQAVTVKIRSTHRGVSANLYEAHNNMIKVVVVGMAEAVTPGQACVFYDGERMLGGGWIMSL